MANTSKRSNKHTTRTIPPKPDKPDEKKPESITLAPTGGTSPGAMGSGPNASTAGPHGDEAHADISSLPLRPETVTPTAPPPTQQQLIAATAGKKGRSRPPRIPNKIVKLTIPAPPIMQLEERVQELI